MSHLQQLYRLVANYEGAGSKLSNTRTNKGLSNTGYPSTRHGDNTKAIQQLKLATEQMDALTGVSVVSSNGESDEGEGVEEGPGEDEDEPGDVDQNDEED